MKPILIAGMSIVNLALISYSLFIYFERKTKSISPKVLTFLTIGVVFDVIATVCMIIGSSKGPFTLHGFIGYSSLMGMLIDTFLLWRARYSNKNRQIITGALHSYSLIAYIWWVLAYITGAILVMGR